MTAKHFVLWVDAGRTRIASLNAYRRGEASWRCDDDRVVPAALVEELGWYEWQTPINGPFPAFAADRAALVARWLEEHGYTARLLSEPPP